MKPSELIGKQFEFNGFDCTVLSIDKKEIRYSFRNKAGKELGEASVILSILPDIIAQQKEKERSSFVKSCVIPKTPTTDLFEQVDTLPEQVKNIIDKHQQEGFTYETCEQMLAELEPFGYTFEWYLDAIPFNLRLI